MYTFYVVVQHFETGMLSNLNYKTDNEILTERDLLNIEELHSKKANGVIKVTTQVVSWQRLNA